MANLSDNTGVGRSLFTALENVTNTSVAQGEVCYFNGTDWVNLGVGTNGQVLSTQGAGANPQWVAAGGGTGVVTNSSYEYDNTVTEADPGAGKFRLDAAPASAVFMYISNVDKAGIDMGTWLLALTSGTHLRMGQSDLSTAGELYTVGAVTDNTTWVKVALIHVDSGTSSLTNAKVYGIQFEGGGSGGGGSSVDTEWVSYTPSTQGLGTVTAVNFEWRRAGPNMEIKGILTAGTPTGVECQIGIADSQTISLAASMQIGTWALGRSTTAHGGFILGTDADTFVNLSHREVFSTNTATSRNALTIETGSNVASSSGDEISITFSVPITGWTSGSGGGGGGSVDTDWVSFTPTATSFGTLSNSIGRWRRVGDSMEVQASFAAGTSLAAAGSIDIPAGEALDASKIAGTALNYLGRAQHVAGTLAYKDRELYLFYDGSDTGVLFISTAASSNGVMAKVNANTQINGGEEIMYRFTVPISGWSVGGGGGGSSTIEVAIFEDVKSSSTGGGNTVTGSQQTHDLQTTSTLPSWAALSSDQMSIDPGTYLVQGGCWFYNSVVGCFSILRRITATATNEAVSRTGVAEANVSDYPEFSVIVVVTAANTLYELQYVAQNAISSGLGLSRGSNVTPNQPNKYATVTWTKIA